MKVSKLKVGVFIYGMGGGGFVLADDARFCIVIFVDTLYGDLFIRSVARIYWGWFSYRLDELSFYVAAWLLARAW